MINERSKRQRKTQFYSAIGSCRRLQKDFEEEYILDDEPGNPKNHQHHEGCVSAQKPFQKRVRDVVSTIRAIENPFLDDFNEPVTLRCRLQEGKISVKL